MEASQAAQTRARRSAWMRWVSIAGAGAVAVVLVAIAVTLAATGQLYKYLYRPLPMGWVNIPAGEFTMGSLPTDARADVVEFPQHAVYLDAYQIARHEVTNKQYAQCVRAGACAAPKVFKSGIEPSLERASEDSRYSDPELEDHPVIYMSWNEAQTFCRWVGGRLPTEAEWEKAARGSSDARRYPWGNEDPDCSRANYAGASGYCVGDTSAVGSYPAGASPYGVLDMAGNVWEWVADWYDDGYYASSPASNPQGPESGTFHGLRGGSWDYEEQFTRAASRYALRPLTWSFDNLGIRCARSP